MKKTLFELWLTVKRAHNPAWVRVLALLAMALIGFMVLLFSPIWILARSGGRPSEDDSMINKTGAVIGTDRDWWGY